MNIINLLVRKHYSVLLVLKKEARKHVSRSCTFIITTYEYLARESIHFPGIHANLTLSVREYWGAKKHYLSKNTQRSIYAVKIYAKQYLYFYIINQS